MMKKIILTFIFLLSLICTMPVQSAQAQVISGEEVEAATINKINEILDNQGDMRRREVNFLRSINDWVVPDGFAEIDVSLPGRINYAGMTTVAVRYKVDGRTFKMINFTVQIHIYDTVLVAAHDLLYDQSLTEADFRVSEVVVDGRNDFIKNYADIKSLVPTRMIRAGSPVAKSMFQTAQVIKNNQPVRLLIRYHGIIASAKGIAMGRGRVGQMIQVKNESSGKIITGKVIDEQTVEVIY